MLESILSKNDFLGSAEAELFLCFSKAPLLTLERTVFRTRVLPDPVLSVRGKMPGAYTGASTFQWYLGPQALMVFLLRAASKTRPAMLPLMEGGAGSLPACLDAIIEKSSQWIYDLFGCKADGTPLIKRIIRRKNPGRRRGGEVALALNENFLSPSSIRVFVDGSLVSDRNELSLLADELELLWHSKKTEKRTRRSDLEHYAR